MKSLGYRTDLFLLSFEGKITEREEYLVVETPENPSFFWGNLLFFPHPPKPGEAPYWIDCFRREFSHQPLVEHCTLAWDSPQAERGAASEFQGFILEESIVLTAPNAHAPPKVHPSLQVRPLESDEDWQQACANQIASREASFSLEKYTPFKQKQMARYRRMSEAGKGFWFGAFLGDKLVGDLGIFFHEGLARFQSVGTHPDYRRQGICGTLVWQSAQQMRKKFPVEAFVMVADENYHAARIYESVGFRAKEKQIGVYRFPESWKK